LGLARPLLLDRIEAMGDDAQLLAGATLAALNDSSPVSFRWINRWLAYALNRSFEFDSMMGLPHLHDMVERGRMILGENVFTSLPPTESEDDVIDEAAPPK